MSAYITRRARDTIARLAGQGLDLPTFWRESSAALARVVPHYMTPCWFTLDPASLLVTSHYQTEFWSCRRRWLAHEYYGGRCPQAGRRRSSERGISTLHEATGGDPSRSPGWQPLHASLRGGAGTARRPAHPDGRRLGHAWSLPRAGQPLFDADELRFLREVAPYLAEGARRGLLVGEATDPDAPEAPGLVVLREDWSVESLTPGVERWLAELPDSDWEGAALCPRRCWRWRVERFAPPRIRIHRARLRWRGCSRARAAGWCSTAPRSSPTAARRGGHRRARPPARIASLLMAAYGLTEREQDVTRLVLQGNSTAEIAAQLRVSAQTVQQHLKSIFDKTGVRSRRDLVGKVFFAHYEPRLRDNEQRAIAGRPLRGGPLDRRVNA